MKKYTVTGMSCAACSARVEKAVSAVPGVTSCAVSLLTNSMGVEGTAAEASVCAAVEQAGYGAFPEGAAPPAEGPSSGNPLEDHRTPALKRRLLSSLGLLAIILYLSMGYTMWNWPLPAFLDNCVSCGLLELLLATAIALINRKFFISGTRALLHRAPNMDTLVSLGSAAAYIYSVYALLAMIHALAAQGMQQAQIWTQELYFESSAMILTLITVGKMLEARSKGKTTDALKDLMHLAPKTAWRLQDGRPEEIPVEDLRPGDLFLVRPGSAIPVDGIVVRGSGAVDESALTGESIPRDKTEGDRVSAGTLNRNGSLECRAERTGQDTTLAEIIRLVSDASATKAPVARMADRVAAVFVPAVMAAAVLTVAIWLLAGESVGFALARGISVLVISCPCSLGLATPVAIMVGSGLGARHGILFKTASALEMAGRIETIALDKTGTVTQGKPEVTDVLPAAGETASRLLQTAVSLERDSEHPIAAAICGYAGQQNVLPLPVEHFQAMAGQGLTARSGESLLWGGNAKLAQHYVNLASLAGPETEQLARQGKTPVFFGEDHRLLGILAVADRVKPESRQALEELDGLGIHTVMLTGDNEHTARAIGEETGISRILAGLLPADKNRAVRKLLTEGKTAMVGDGINDAPALAAADLGIAIGAGTDVAIDAADLVLMNSRLTDVPAAIRLGRATLTNIRENLFWAFFYNAVGIPIAAGVLIRPFGITLNPMIAAACMSLSSFCVVSNALRLNLLKLYDPRHDRKRRPNTKHKKEKEPMTKTMSIEGMMCPHCEARVKKTLEALDGVLAAEVSHVTGTAVVALTGPVEDEVLTQAVTAQGYEVKSIQH